MICILIGDLYNNEDTICPEIVDFCLYKPFDIKDLFHIVQKFIVDGGPD